MVTDIEILKKQGHIVYSDSYLKSMKKKWLISYIRCLEHNWANAELKTERQYKLLTKAEADIANVEEVFNSCGNCLHMECDYDECYCHKHRIEENGDSFPTKCPNNFMCDDWEQN